MFQLLVGMSKRLLIHILLVTSTTFAAAYTSDPAKNPRSNSLTVSTNPNITYLEPQFFHHLHPERVKVKYGPYTVPRNTENAGMNTYFETDATKPCSDCLITWIQAGLEYPDGSYANVNTGMWLHHVVLYNANEVDATCPGWIQRFFASGNERTAINICVNGTKEAGHYLSPNATLMSMTELMNENPENIAVVVTITYEYIPFKPHHFRTTTPVWLDITGSCGVSDYNVTANETQFSVSENPGWNSVIAGEVVFAAEHLHDGGVSISILKNNISVCDSIATYGATPGYMDGNSTTGMGNGMNGTMNMDTVHVSNMSDCIGIGNMKVGEEWSVRADYDFDMHAPMLDADGMPAPVMGIGLLYVAEPRGADRDASY